jgi:multidrug efflux pump subunit AcrA (membrane-fusion protein)
LDLLMTDDDRSAWDQAMARAERAEAERRRLVEAAREAAALEQQRAELGDALAAARIELGDARAAAPFPQGWVLVAVGLAMFVVAMAWVILVAQC